MRRKSKESLQWALAPPQSRSWGGRRRGAGRKRVAKRKGVPHDKRPQHKPRFPLHVTLKARRNWLRNRDTLAIVTETLKRTRDAHQETVRIVHYSLQRDHLHLIVEAEDEHALAASMQGLASILARRINRAQGQEGALWVERYHARELKTPAEVRNAIRYVLLNAKKHREKATGPDEYSSARGFDGWKRIPTGTGEEDTPVSAARTWLINIGWKRLGLIGLDERIARL